MLVCFVCSCPSRDEFPLIETEDKALLRRLRGKSPFIFTSHSFQFLLLSLHLSYLLSSFFTLLPPTSSPSPFSLSFTLIQNKNRQFQILSKVSPCLSPLFPSPPPPQLTSSRRTGRCWSSFRSESPCFLTWWRQQEEKEKKEVLSSVSPPPGPPPPPPPSAPGSCSEPTLLTLLRPSRSSPPPSLKVSSCFQFSHETKQRPHTESLYFLCF